MSSIRQVAPILVLTSLAACRSPVSEAKAEQRPARDAARHVETALAATQSIPRTLKLRGTLEPNRHSDVASDAAGKVLATSAERGSLVKKGAVLARLDVSSAALGATQARADRASAEADAALAADELVRTQKLVQSGSIGEAELVRARSRKLAAEERAGSLGAKAALSSKSVSDGVIRAPFDGLVAERFVDEGEYVGPATKIVTLVDVATLRLNLFVPESAARAVHEGQEVSFTVARSGGSDAADMHHARVRYVGPELHAGSRELVVEAVVANADGALVPGGFATARVALGERPAVVVPVDALRKIGATTHVFVVRDGHVEDRLVDVDDGTPGAVLDGLANGERVVLRPSPELRDGAAVE